MVSPADPRADSIPPPLGFPEPSARRHMTRPAPNRTNAAHAFGETERRSRCETLPQRPCLKLANKPSKPAPLQSPQPVEPAHDIGALALSAEGGTSPYISCRPCWAFAPMPGRGGARNRASRRTKAISEAAAGRLLKAAHYAAAAGMPLNRFTTVHWQKAGVADGLAATGRFLKLAGDWIRSRGGRFAWIWVREGGSEKGEHVHILLHLPPHLAGGFNRRQRGWLKACGAAWRAGVILSPPIGRCLAHAYQGELAGRSYAVNLGVVLDYVLKGADHRARESLGIRRREHGGEIVGKRCGVSQNIGAAARQREERDKEGHRAAIGTLP